MRGEYRERRTFFEQCIARMHRPTAVPRERFACPCCGYPTLAARDRYEACILCWWEDDGQDDADAAEVRGGPNADYSLERARANFAHHLTMYDPGRDTRVGGEDTPDIVEAKRALIARYESMTPETAGDETLWSDLLAAEMHLRAVENLHRDSDIPYVRHAAEFAESPSPEMSDALAQQADDPAEELEITPEMWRAGISAAWDHSPGLPNAQELVFRVYVAMERARRDGPFIVSSKGSRN